MLKSGMILDDRYEILSKIGSGGMSTVYKGRDQKLNRNVAIKVLKSEYREDANFVRKFREEAQAAARLAHPNIVNVYDVGEEMGIHYIVMELVEGITLKNYIERKGKLTIREATSIAIQVSMGLEVAHNNDIVHRDIKPQNVMISKDGKVKVMDFGIAKAASSETISSNAMGSVHYTSPEQARGGYSDAKSDIYSLGIVMYEMVTGRVPFDGETTVAVAVKHLQEEMPSPKIFCPELPISLENIIYKCTEKTSAKRYANMSELIADLKQSLQTPDVNFVKRVDIDEAAKTVTISKKELDKIKKETGRIHILEAEKEETPAETQKKYETEEIEDVNEYGYDDDDDDDDDDDMDPRMEKIMTIGGVAAAVIILIMIVLLAGKIFGLGLFSGKSDKDSNSSQIEQSEELVEMIDLKGKTWDEAKTMLNKMGLGITSGGSEESEEYEEGQILRQSAEPGDMVEKNSTITVVLASKSTKMITISNVADQNKDDAAYRLEQEGFKVDYSEEYSSKISQGRVIRTVPEIGSEAAEGSTIVLVISKGPEIKYTTVPDLKGKSKADAEAALKNANLEPGNVTESFSSDVTAGLVISQSHGSGTEVEEGKKIDFVISKGPELVEVPGLWGNPRERAIEKLEALGLKYEITEEYSEEVTGRVFEYTPGEGEKVAPGTVVKIVISKGAKPAEEAKPETTPTQPEETPGDQNQGEKTDGE